jgi:hypothetical protein
MDKREMNKDRLVTADMLQNLPEPVQRYLTYTGVIGKPWMVMAVEQCYTTNPPGFLWKARFKVAGLPLMRGSDTYKAGHGHMFGKLAGLFTLFDARGEKMDQGSMLRYLNEMTWFPVTFLNDYVTWQAVDGHCAAATFTDCGKSVSARLFFDDAGRLLNFITQRYRENNGQYSLDTWSTPMTAYGTRAGLKLPVRGMGVWNLPSGDLPYIETELTEIEYNQPIETF